jgi:hypothetical protein
VAAQGKLIDVKGLQTVDRALKQVAPDLRREMFREVGSLVKTRVSAAKAQTPYRRKRPSSQTSNVHLRTGTRLTKAGSKVSVAAGGGSRKQGLFGFQAVSLAAHATIMDLGKPQGPVTRGIEAKYGPAPRFLGRQFLPSGQGGTQMWRQSRNIVERYIGQLNSRIESQAVA